MEATLGVGMKVCSNGPGHMTKMAATPFAGQNLLKIYRIRRLMGHWGCGPYQVCSNDDLRVASLLHGQNCFQSIRW